MRDVEVHTRYLVTGFPRDKPSGEYDVSVGSPVMRISSPFSVTAVDYATVVKNLVDTPLGPVPKPELALLIRCAHIYVGFAMDPYPLPVATVRLDELAQVMDLIALDSFSAAEHHRVVSCLRSAVQTSTPATGPAGEVVSALNAVLGGPVRPELTKLLAELITPGITLGRGAPRPADDPQAAQQWAWRALVTQAAQADAVSRVYMHLGNRRPDAVPVAVADRPGTVPAISRMAEITRGPRGKNHGCNRKRSLVAIG